MTVVTSAPFYVHFVASSSSLYVCYVTKTELQRRGKATLACPDPLFWMASVCLKKLGDHLLCGRCKECFARSLYKVEIWGCKIWP